MTVHSPFSMTENHKQIKFFDTHFLPHILPNALINPTHHFAFPCFPTVSVKFQTGCSPNPMRPRVSPRILAAPDATSRICSTLWTRVPSRRAWYNQVFRRYRLRMWQSVESAVSSTAAEGMLHTAMPREIK